MFTGVFSELQRIHTCCPSSSSFSFSPSFKLHRERERVLDPDWSFVCSLERKEEGLVAAEMEVVELPDDFKCPISLEVMSDPVILTSGHTFDRSSIQRWLDSGNRTCPVTKLPLPLHPPLIPNHALRSLISNFALTSSSNSPPHHYSSSPPSASSSPFYSSQTTNPQYRRLVSSLTFPSTSEALAQIHQISKKDSAFCRYLSDCGAIGVLLRHVGSEVYPELQELALRIVLDVSLDGDDVKVGLVADGAVDCVVTALMVNSSCRALAATTLTSLAMADVNKCTIGAYPSAIAGLVVVLREGRGREKREAATALYVLCSFPDNRKRVVRLGAVPVLVELADSGVERAVEVLGLLGKCREGREEMRMLDGFVGVLARVLNRGTARGIEHTLIVVNLVCADSEDIRIQVWKEGILDTALSLVGDENGTIGRNAARLVDTLQRRGFESLILS